VRPSSSSTGQHSEAYPANCISVAGIPVPDRHGINSDPFSGLLLQKPRSKLTSNRAAFSRGNLAALGDADSAGLGTLPTVVMAVNPTLLRAPFAHESAECADFFDVSTVSRHCTDAELTKLQTLVAAYRAIIIASLRRHALDTLLASQDAILAGLDALAIGFVQLRHEESPFLRYSPRSNKSRPVREPLACWNKHPPSRRSQDQ